MQTNFSINHKKDLKLKKETKDKNYLHNLLKLMYCKLTPKYQNYVHPKSFILVNSTYGHLNRYALKLFLFLFLNRVYSWHQTKEVCLARFAVECYLPKWILKYYVYEWHVHCISATYQHYKIINLVDIHLIHSY